jgi:hypothetical protein
MTKTMIAILLLVSSYTVAQELKPRHSVEEIQQMKWKMIVEATKMSAKDIELIQPFFLEHEKSMWNLHQQKRMFFKTEQQKDGEDKVNYAQLNDQYVEFEVKEAELVKKYHSQLKKLLSPQSLYVYYKAQREFKRKLLDDMRGKRNEKRPIAE